RQARSGDVAGRVVTLKLRGADFKIITRRKTLPVPTQTTRSILAIGKELLAAELKSGGANRSWRLIGVGITDLIEPQDVEDDFFGGDERRTLVGEKAADAIRARFGPAALTSARALRGKSSAQD
ncbi:MAG: DNA polymerase IV, partial [Phenylobacterium sp.]|nr:DNA polymerase IV [Phenylobacterium sp.]